MFPSRVQRAGMAAVLGVVGSMSGWTAGTAAAADPAAASDPVLVGAGDIASCSETADSATAKLLDGLPGTVFTLGDNAYPDGSASQYSACYVPAWGRHRTRTRPAAGNHEYYTAGARPYFAYFGSAAGAPGKGWYSYGLGSWRIVVLNSNCAEVGGCGPGSAQLAWLETILTTYRSANVLAYWHHPRFSSGEHGETASMQAAWELLYAYGADIVLNGHEHDYERFARQDPWRRADATFGIREFVVGTGGAPLRERASNASNSQVFSTTHGVLQLTLRAASYSWRFVPIAGSTFTDAGSSETHDAPPVRTRRTFTVGADAYVSQAHPDARFGTSTRLLVDGDTGSGLDAESYLKASVGGITGRVDRAVLRLWVTNGTADGPRVYPTGTSWSGRTITWRNRPAATGAAIRDLGRVAAGGWLDIDVS
ncbi:MAG: DNRLRE domain-containing protein, partial [Candidatus Limnocylindrales bacterium]